MKYLDLLKTKNRPITSQPKLPIAQTCSPDATAKTAKYSFDSNGSRPRWHTSKKSVPKAELRHKNEQVQKQQERHQARIENGEFKLLYPTKDPAPIIVGLTRNDLPLQKELLRRHCQRYDPITHFPDLKEKWEEKAAILEYCAELPREEAEMEAAKIYHLGAFMDELRT